MALEQHRRRVRRTARAEQLNSTDPSSFLLLGTGLLGLAYGIRRHWMQLTR